MNTQSNLAFSVMLANMGITYGVDTVEKTFAVSPTVQQKLVDKIVAGNSFLRDINYVIVDQIKGEKVIGAVSQAPGSRTDTSDSGERTTTSLLSLGSQDYELHPTNYDTHLRYATMNAWAKFKDFQQRYSQWIMQARTASIIKVGWYGESAATTTNATNNPNGEDVNIGWLQKLRAYNSGSQFFSAGAADDGETPPVSLNQIRIGSGTGNDFVNLDSAVHACLSMIDPIHQTDDLVAIIGSELVSDEKQRVLTAYGSKPTEKERSEAEAVTSIYAGLPYVKVPGFPARGLLVTALKNLSYYEQEGSERKQVVDNPKKDRVENYTQVASGYVVENEEAAAAFEFKNVKLWDGTNWV